MSQLANQYEQRGAPRSWSKPDLRFEVIRDDRGFRDLAPEWEALRRECRPELPYLSFAWLSAAWEISRQRAQLYIVTARHEGKLVGIAPLRRERHFGLRELCFLGKGVAPYVAFLCAPGYVDLEMRLLDSLAERKKDWDLLRLTQLADSFTRLHRSVPGKERLHRVEPCPWAGAAYVAFDGDWEALRRSGLSWLKEGHRRVSRFEKEGGSWERYQGREAAPHVDEILAIERHSWQGRYGQSHSEAERSQLVTLFRHAFTAFGDQPAIELWLGRVAGEPVAYEINFLSPERIWLHRGAYDERFKKLSPGVVLDYLSIRQAWEEGRREFDYLSGGEPYKGQRTHALRPLMRLGAAPRTLRGHLAFAAVVRLPSWLRRVRAADELLQFLSRVRKSPRSLLPGSGVVASRVHH